ncbi:MAG: hypothetical protein V3S02_04435 [Dehalococcoidales bacterium]
MIKKKLFFRLLSGLVLAGTVALGQFSVALANGEDGHIGSTGISVTVAWIGGGVLGGLLLFIFVARVFFKQTGKPSGSGEGESEMNPQGNEERKG